MSLHALALDGLSVLLSRHLPIGPSLQLHTQFQISTPLRSCAHTHTFTQVVFSPLSVSSFFFFFFFFGITSEQQLTHTTRHLKPHNHTHARTHKQPAAAHQKKKKLLLRPGQQRKKKGLLPHTPSCFPHATTHHAHTHAQTQTRTHTTHGWCGVPPKIARNHTELKCWRKTHRPQNKHTNIRCEKKKNEGEDLSPKEKPAQKIREEKGKKTEKLFFSEPSAHTHTHKMYVTRNPCVNDWCVVWFAASRSPCDLLSPLLPTQ